MSTGKAAAQAQHAAVEAFRLSNKALVDEWYSGGHYTKIVFEAENEQALYTIKTYIEERGFSTKLIIDEGLTEISPHQVTALGIELVDRNIQHVKDTFGSFRLYNDIVKVSLEFKR